MVRGTMIALVVVCLTISSTASAAGSQTAFMDLAGAIDAAKSTAAPGGTAPKMADGVAIVGWKTTPQTGKTRGVYTVHFKQPTAIGTIVIYSKGQVSHQSDGKWTGAAYTGPPEHTLRFIPLPPGTKATAIRITVPPRLITSGRNVGRYATSLAFVAALPGRCANLAPNAAVLVSSAAALSRGFEPVIGLNQPWSMVDGAVNRGRNFKTLKRGEKDEPVSPKSPEWITLVWDRPQQLSALMLARGSSEKGLGDGVIQTYAGDGDPRFAVGDEGWRAVKAPPSKAIGFRSLQIVDLGGTVSTRAVRLKITSGKVLGMGEIVALTDLKKAAPPAFAARTGGLKAIPFDVPGPGSVTIQVRDAAGSVVANPVAGVKYSAGKHTAWWDLKDIDGKMIMSPGAYTWRGLYNPGLRLEFKYSYYPYPVKGMAWKTADRTGGWLADHEAPRTVARHGDKMWLGAFAESGDSIIQTDADMNKLWGEFRIWLAEPGWICSDGKWVYYLAEGGWMGDRQVIIQIDGETRRSRRLFVRELPKRYREKVNGFQMVGNKAFISATKTNSVRVYDLTVNLAGPWRSFGWGAVSQQFENEKPRLIKEIPLERPGRIRKYGAGKLVTTSGKDIVLIDVATYKVTTLIAGKLTNPKGLGVDAKGNLYVGEGDPLHQVLVYSPKGRLLQTLGNKGGREIGPFDFQDLDSPSGVEVGPRGRVWVAEHTDFPKRVSVWDPKTGKCVRHVLGPTKYGGGGCIDPGDDSRMFYKGLEFHRDRKTGKVTLKNIMYLPDTKAFEKFSAKNYPSYAFRAEGKLWFTSVMAPHGQSLQVLWQHKGDRVQPVAANGSIKALRALVKETWEGFFREKVLERIDPQIDFNWWSTSPGKGVDKDRFAVRWTGRIIIPTGGTYTFYTTSDTGARLTIGGKEIINNRRESWRATSATAPIELAAGSHELRLEFFERTGNATMKLEWEGPGFERQTIPTDSLRTAAGDDAPKGLKGEYYNFGLAWLEDNYPQHKENQFLFTWTDLNDNGFVDTKEVRFGAAAPAGTKKYVTSLGVGWNWLMNENFETATGASGPGVRGIVFFRANKNRSKHGYPIFELPKTVVAHSGGQAVVVDLKGNAICLTGPMASVSPAGKVNWRYINEWPGLHAGHNTTARGDEPGVMIAPCRLWGTAVIEPGIGEIFVACSNLGCLYVFTAEDGLWVDRLLRDARVGLSWRMSERPTPEMMGEISLSGEPFGGTLQQCIGADGKDHLYFVGGKPHSSVVEVLGMDKVKRLPGGKFKITPQDIAAAELRTQQAMAKQAPPKIYAVGRAGADDIKIDGKDDEWPKERIDGFALAYDDKNLYVMFKGRDSRATFKNNAVDFMDIFKHGDVVDVKLQTSASAKPGRSKAGPGDIRLSFAMFGGKPTCILYDYDVPEIKRGRSFSSPWRSEWIDRVVVIPEAKIKVARTRGDYCLEAAVPLKLIHLDPKALGSTRGDVGRVLSDQTGTAAAARAYWANKNTNIVSDVPSEAALQPNLWGLFVFERD